MTAGLLHELCPGAGQALRPAQQGAALQQFLDGLPSAAGCALPLKDVIEISLVFAFAQYNPSDERITIAASALWQSHQPSPICIFPPKDRRASTVAEIKGL